MVELKYRTFWRRVLAGMADGILFWPLSIVNHWIYGGSAPVTLRVAWFVAYSFAFMAYSISLHARFGQTLGKMVARVKVLDVSETKLSLKQALLRDIVPLALTLVSIPFGLPRVLGGENPARPKHIDTGLWLQLWASLGWFLAEVVTMLTNSKRRALHDFIARSVVVRTSPVSSVEPGGAAAV